MNHGRELPFRIKASKLLDSSKLGVPHEIRGCIKGRVIDLSIAHEYDRKLWDAIRPRVKAVVTHLGQNRYELSRRFFQFFLKKLCELLDAVKFPHSKRNAGDFVAWALCNACKTYGVPQKPPARGPILLWPEDRPVSEAWRSLGELPVPKGGSVVFEDPGPGQTLQIPKSERYLSPRIELRTHINNNKNALPKITIEIEGEQVCLPMKAMMWTDDADERRAMRDEARRIWKPLFKELKVMINIEQRGEGRPLEFLFEEAAHLKYHDNCSWREVTKRLCPIKHTTHSEACKERLRRGVDKFFKRLSSYALQLPPVTG